MTNIIAVAHPEKAEWHLCKPDGSVEVMSYARFNEWRKNPGNTYVTRILGSYQYRMPDDPMFAEGVSPPKTRAEAFVAWRRFWVCEDRGRLVGEDPLADAAQLQPNSHRHEVKQSSIPPSRTMWRVILLNRTGQSSLKIGRWMGISRNRVYELWREGMDRLEEFY